MNQAKSDGVTIVKKRKQRIGNTIFHVRSVFSGKINLDDAMKNIVMRKLKNSRPSETE